MFSFNGRMPRPVSRREFVRRFGDTAAGLLAGSALMSCGSDSTGPGQTAAKGKIEGVVVDSSSVPQASLGRIFLMSSDGRMTGRYADVDPAGKFAFADVATGNWQLRFDAPRVAEVDEDHGAENPQRITVEASKTTSVVFPVVRGVPEEMEVEIYIGDYFFYEVPFGAENGTTTVKLGSTVCWYNVGLQVHTVSGGPWGSSGDLDRAANFIWKADTAGRFPYRCAHHPSQMIATLVVTA